jgi:hypothetical protein
MPFLLFFLAFGSAAVPCQEARERFALVDLYNSTNGNHGWFNANGWLSNSSFCTWAGVMCVPNWPCDSVSALDLRAFSPRGPIPESVGSLVNLRAFWSSFAASFSSLPESLGELSSLVVLQVNGNVQLPESLGNLQMLQNLTITGLSGRLPLGLWALQSLRFLNLQGRFVGPISDGIGQLTELREIMLYSFLDSSDWLGDLPDTFSNLLDLESVQISVGSSSGRPILKGNFPVSLANLPRLRVVALSGNFSSPSVIPDFEAPLEELMVSGFNFASGISSTFCSAVGKTLSQLSISGGFLQGPLPSFNLCIALQRITIMGTKATGPLPDFDLPLISYISLDINAFSGEFPSTWIGLPKSANATLEFYVDGNNLSVLNSNLTEPTRWKECGMGNNPWKCPIPAWAASKCGAVCVND